MVAMEPDAPTELAGLADYSTEAVQAWSLAADDDDDYPDRPRRITAMALGACLASVAAAGAVALVALPDEPVEPVRVVQTVTPAPVAAPPPPKPAPPSVTVTVQAEPPTVTKVAAPPPEPPKAAAPPQIPDSVVAEYDRAFLNRLSAEGWIIGNPTAMTANAHLVCAALQRGVPAPLVNRDLIMKVGMTATEAMLFMNATTQTYPDCP